MAKRTRKKGGRPTRPASPGRTPGQRQGQTPGQRQGQRDTTSLIQQRLNRFKRRDRVTTQDDFVFAPLLDTREPLFVHFASIENARKVLMIRAIQGCKHFIDPILHEYRSRVIDADTYAQKSYDFAVRVLEACNIHFTESFEQDYKRLSVQMFNTETA